MMYTSYGILSILIGHTYSLLYNIVVLKIIIIKKKKLLSKNNQMKIRVMKLMEHFVYR